jgi:hypothetical protein
MHICDQLYLLDREPLPEPNRSLPSSIIGNMALVLRKNVPAANVAEPIRQRNENRNTPTENIKCTESFI